MQTARIEHGLTRSLLTAEREQSSSNSHTGCWSHSSTGKPICTSWSTDDVQQVVSMASKHDQKQPERPKAVLQHQILCNDIRGMALQVAASVTSR